MKSPANVAFINPKVLQWARNRAGFSYDQLEHRLSIKGSDFAAWEAGESRPPFDKAQKVADALSIPFGYLFLSNPPETDIPLPDLRTQEDRQPLSLNFLEVVNDALVRQDWWREYAQENKIPKLKFVGSFSLNDDPVEIAADVRKTLGITAALRHSVDNWSSYLSKLAGLSEDIGILVMRSGVVGNATRRKLSSREFQGFALTDPQAPVVFVNSEDFKSAQIFTLVHELAHIWIGKNAVSYLDPTKTDEPISTIEKFCNAVAAETLVPAIEFERAWSGTDVEALTARLSRHFWVSSLVVLRRAYELERITRPVFLDHIERERKKIKKSQASGGDYYRNIFARMSSQFTKAVLTEARQGNLLYRDAARLLSMKVPTLVKFIQKNR